MKIAVLISGEYRTFDICRSTMYFLNIPDADIYFSTWNRSIIKNNLLGVDINEEVTHVRIIQALKRSASMLVEPINSFVGKRYNSKMIYRWIQGLELIKNSGIEYDYITVVRPDLYFNVEYGIDLKEILGKETKKSIMIACNRPPEKKWLQDIFFIMPYEYAKKILSIRLLEWWENLPNAEADWHRRWFDFVYSYTTDIIELPWWSHVVWCRPPASVDNSFREIYEYARVWRDSIAVKELGTHGREFMVKYFNEEYVKDIERKIANNYFEQFNKLHNKTILN